jgi:hypothetical protein
MELYLTIVPWGSKCCSALELETSPRAAEAANPRLYLPAEYDRVQGLGTVVPTQS